MKKTNIHFKCSWGQTCDELIQRYSIMAPGSKPVWKEITADSTKPADLTVALQLPSFNDNNCLHLRREPEIIERWPVDVVGNNVFDYSTIEKYHVTTWWLTKNYDFLSSLKRPDKKYKVSTLSSLKHKHRTDFINNISSMSDTIDVYGHISGKIVPLTSLRDNVFLKYEKSICIENCSVNNYFTEKIIDCILGWCMPIYWGCPNISSFLPEGSYRNIDLDDYSTAIDIINEPVNETELKSIAEARDLILNKYNIWPTMYNYINSL